MLENPDKLTCRAAAKVNLFLEVLSRRDDGYHEIRSVVIPVSLCDDVTLERTDGQIETSVECEGACAAGVSISPEQNLATRAALALREKTGYAGGARIHLRKRIPVGGGLGGGSSDAAAVLVGLDQLWGTGLLAGDLMEIGGSLGSDIPALIHGGAVLAEGRGERITPLAVAPGVGWWLVLANPRISCSTADIYARCTPALTSADGAFRNICFALEQGDLACVPDGLFNGLQEAVFRKVPFIQMLVEDLEAAGSAGSQVSGSGSTVFALARDEADARRIEAALVRKHGASIWCEVVRTLPDGVMVAHGPLEA